MRDDESIYIEPTIIPCEILDKVLRRYRMARIPEAELERLKREVSLVRLIQSQGHELKKVRIDVVD